MDSHTPSTTGPSAGALDGARAAEEAALRASVLRGDKAAWRALYGRAFDGLYRYIYFRSNRDESRAEETAQETWMIAVRTIAKFDPERAAFETWLRAIATNVLRNAARRRSRDAGAELTDTSPAARPSTGADAELAEQITLAMTSLPDNYQDVLRQRYEQDSSLAEIAALRGTTTKAAESLLGRARAAFRAAYTRLDPTAPEEIR